MTDNVTGGAPTPTSQQVDPNVFGINIDYTVGDHKMNMDLAVQVVFLQYHQVMDLRTQDKLEEVQGTLDEMNKSREMYNRMKALKEKAGGGTSTMPDDMVEFLNSRGIQYDHTGGDNKHNSKEWDINMADLDSYLQKISGQNKTQMLELNQCVEDGNNALREVSTVFSKYSEILQSIIQTINR